MKIITPAEILASRPLRPVSELILRLMIYKRWNFEKGALKFGYGKTARALRARFLEDDGDTFETHRCLEMVGVTMFRDSGGWLNGENGKYLKAKWDALDMTNRDKVLVMHPELREDELALNRKKDAYEKFLPKGDKIENIAAICQLTGDEFPLLQDVRKPIISQAAAKRLRQLYLNLGYGQVGQ